VFDRAELFAKEVPLVFRQARIREAVKNSKFCKSMGFKAAFQVVRVTGKAENTGNGRQKVGAAKPTG
jgi:hypothetical protein